MSNEKIFQSSESPRNKHYQKKVLYSHDLDLLTLTYMVGLRKSERKQKMQNVYLTTAT